jgi:hypothetical protein
MVKRREEKGCVIKASKCTKMIKGKGRRRMLEELR